MAISARQEPAAEAVVARRAAEAGIPLLVEGRDLRVRVRHASLDGQWLDLEGPGWRIDDVRCALLGVFQPGNALLAAAAARALGADDSAIRRGLEATSWPGRFQLIRRSPPVIVDGAHNPAGARALAASLKAYLPGQRVTFVIGTSEDKDKAGILDPLLPLARRMIFVAADHPRSASAASLAALARRLSPGRGSSSKRPPPPRKPYGWPLPIPRPLPFVSRGRSSS